MDELTGEGRRVVEEAARRHGVSPETAAALLAALARGSGTQAQFNIPELGGMGQWSWGGMTMVGDMFNTSLAARVDALCSELAGHVGEVKAGRASGGGGWWPAELGEPASAGSQNDARYAVFPGARRLAIERGGRVTVYDTGDHQIGGVGQQQAGAGSVSFTSQFGTVALDRLRVVSGEVPAPGPGEAPRAAAAERAGSGGSGEEPAPGRGEALRATAAERGSGDPDDVFVKIERLAELKAKGLISEPEFEAKKAELLSRI